MKRQSVEPLEPLPVAIVGNAIADLACEAIDSFISDLRRPEFRAGFTVSLATAALLARRLGFLPALAISLMAGVSAEHLYGMAEDIHAKLTGGSQELFFHNDAGCPGHTTGMPAEGCLGYIDDAPRKV